MTEKQIADFITSGDTELDRLLKFTAEIDKMTSILRRTVLIDGSRRENDAEHSWHISVMAMIFSGYAAEKPDIGRAVKMCAVHDLVEIYAGDTFAYDPAANSDKKEREKAAADRLFSLLPSEQGNEIRSLWEEFDGADTADAKYAACMDRIQPFMHNTMTGGHTWVEGNTSRNQVEERMRIVKEFMPEVYGWIEKNLDEAEKRGWLRKRHDTKNPPDVLT